MKKYNITYTKFSNSKKKENYWPNTVVFFF